MDAIITLFMGLFLNITALPADVAKAQEDRPAEERTLNAVPDPRTPQLPGAPGGAMPADVRFGKNERTKADTSF